MDTGVYVLASDIRVLEGPGERVLINPANLEWIKLTLDAYRLAENERELRLDELLRREAACRGADPAQLHALFSYLHDAGFVVCATRVLTLTKVYLNVTNRCNLSCPACYFAASEAEGSDPVGTSGIIEVMRALEKAHPRTLVITGGEPLLRRDAADILEFAGARFRDVVVLTNGTLIHEEEAAFIKRAGVRVQVSLESADSAAHDAVRGLGSFDAAVRGLRALIAAGVAGVEIVPTLTRRNLAGARDVIALASSLGAGHHFSLFMPVGRGACHVADLAIPPDEMLSWVAGMLRDVEADDGRLPAWGELDGSPADLWVRRGCGAGSEILSVAPDGSVYPCALLHLPGLALGRLPHDSLSALSRRGKRAVPSVARLPGCLECDVADFCAGGCRAHALVQSGDMLSRDPYCRFYRTLYRALLWGWRDDRPLSANVEALVRALTAGGDPR